VVVADDLGRERLGAEGVTVGPYAVTPNLDALAARSVRFPRAWATPTCSPTRATLLTGRLPRQHGIGTIIWPADRYPLPDTEVFLPQVLASAPVPMTSALVGKWHLNVEDVGSAAMQPGVAGFSAWSATNGNLEKAWTATSGPFGYGNWEHNADGALAIRTDYATEFLVADAVAAMAALPEPWFLYVPLHAMHEPWHTPPAGWRYTEPTADPGIQEQSDLMLESLDLAVGQLLAGLSPTQAESTTVIFLGDNGTMFTVARAPYDADHAKGTLYQGGVNVPLWISGPLVSAPGATSDALVHVADVFDTALALAGIPADEADALVGGAPRLRYGESLLPYVARPDRPSQRAIGYTEAFEPNGPPPWRGRHMATTDGRFKLVFHAQPDLEITELYDLAADPFEADDLLAGASLSDDARAAHEALSTAMAAFEADFPFDAVQPL
jgi:arylsulfatase B